MEGTCTDETCFIHSANPSSQPRGRGGTSRGTARIEELSGKCRCLFPQRRAFVNPLVPQLSACPSDQTSSRLHLLQEALLTLPFFRVCSLHPGTILGTEEHKGRTFSSLLPLAVHTCSALCGSEPPPRLPALSHSAPSVETKVLEGVPPGRVRQERLQRGLRAADEAGLGSPALSWQHRLPASKK